MSSRLVDRISPDYVRPMCPDCGQTMSFVHLNRGGSDYVCLPCTFGSADDWCRPGSNDAPMGNHEASWILRNTKGNERKEKTDD
jgi:hypothetical protein